jgi:hypothetical protein
MKLKSKIQVNVLWNEEKLHFLNTSEWAKTSMYCHNLKNVNCDDEGTSLATDRPYPLDSGATLGNRMEHLKLFYMNQLKRCEPLNASISQ